MFDIYTEYHTPSLNWLSESNDIHTIGAGFLVKVHTCHPEPLSARCSRLMYSEEDQVKSLNGNQFCVDEKKNMTPTLFVVVMKVIVSRTCSVLMCSLGTRNPNGNLSEDVLTQFAQANLERERIV